MTDKYSEMGKARAKSLSKAERTKIAKNAADERWNSALPVATNEGILPLAELELSCVVLPDETRVISQTTFLKAIGRSRSFRGGTGVTSTVGNVPFFLQSKDFDPYLTDIESMPAKPIIYRTKNGKKALGYDALLLPKVAELYLKIRDDMMQKYGKVPNRYQPYVIASDILIRGLADIGIIALVDEATGYQSQRAKDALSKILEQFIAKELRPYIKTFPNEFYEQLYRLRGLTFVRDYNKRPQYFGLLTNDIIYERLAPGVLAELKRITPKNAKGRPKHHLHRRLTVDIGHPKLNEHLAATIALMKISPDYSVFYDFLERAYPKFNHNLQLSLGDKAGPKNKNQKTKG
jgi:hypothetical protein